MLGAAFENFVVAAPRPLPVASNAWTPDVRSARETIQAIEQGIADGSLQGRAVGQAIDDVYEAQLRLGASLANRSTPPTVDENRAASRLISLIGDLGHVARQQDVTRSSAQPQRGLQSRVLQAQSQLPDVFGAGAGAGVLAARQARAVQIAAAVTTRPTGELGGRPTGTSEAVLPNAGPEFKRGIDFQNNALDTVAAAGYRVERLAQVDGDRSPDARIEGRLFDVYSPGGGTSARYIVLPMGKRRTPAEGAARLAQPQGSTTHADGVRANGHTGSPATIRSTPDSIPPELEL